MPNTCEKCQAKLGPEMRFCPICGQKLDTPVTEDPPGDPLVIDPGIQSKDDSNLGVKVGIALAVLFGVCLLAWIMADANKHSASNVKPAPLLSSTPAPLTAEQRRLNALKAEKQKQELLLSAHKLKLAQAQEAARQAKEKAEQDRQAAEDAKEEEEARQRQEEEDRKDQEAYAVIKAKVKRDYPDDYISQKGVYDMAVQAYQDMKLLPDDEIKAKVQHDYPDDYVSQKGVYDMAAKAREEMRALPDDEIKAKMEHDYPDDYISQKGVYDMSRKAKQDMQ